jgi:hypothetical protein
VVVIAVAVLAVVVPVLVVVVACPPPQEASSRPPSVRHNKAQANLFMDFPSYRISLTLHSSDISAANRDGQAESFHALLNCGHLFRSGRCDVIGTCIPMGLRRLADPIV